MSVDEIVMMLAHALTLGVFAMLPFQQRMTERALGDIAVIRLPASVRKAMYEGIRDDEAGRLTFTFATTYFWASFGSGPAYKHQLFVSVMSPDASAAEYAAYPKHFRLSYDGRRTVGTSTVGSGTLTVSEGRYQQNSLNELSYTFLYVDRARRLQIAWHAVKTEVELEAGTELVRRMAESFRIIREPAAELAAARDRPRRESDERARRRTLALETLQREGYGTLEPGKPVLRNDVYVEWMSDPEPRFQLLLPLGRVAVAPDATPATRPRPVRLDRASAGTARLRGTVGWRERADGKWELSNDDNDYLPFEGISALLAAQQPDPGFVYFYYSATVRVEEEPSDERLTSLRWFFDGVPEVRRLWREGKLVRGRSPVDD